MRKSTPFVLTKAIRDILIALSKSYTEAFCLKQRASIILCAEKGWTNIQIANEIGIHYNTVALWRNRFIQELTYLVQVDEEEPKKLKDQVAISLTDLPRSGAPWIFDGAIRLKIRLMACQNPADYGFEASQWSLSLLRQAVINEKIVESISIGAIYHILISAQIKPWNIRYYLHSKEKYESYDTYSAKIQAINELYSQASNLLEQDILVWCTDEMTGIQALEHAYPDKPTMPGMDARMDFNYIRHGVTTLIGFYNVQSGKVFEPFLNDTRKEDDFTHALSQVIDANPDKQHIFVLDNLNTHRSETLVRYVAEKIGFQGDLGIKGQSGILKDMDSRAAFLADKSHAVRFCYVPIHCSWMNQIEIWFGIMNKRLLRRKSFTGVEALENSIRRFAKQYNDLFAHPFKWTYNSVPSIEKYAAEELLDAA